MSIWTETIAIVAAAIAELSQLLGGSLGAAILLVSASLQLLLLPLHLWLGERRILRARGLERLKPELTALKERFKDAPDRLMTETLALYRREGMLFLDLRGMLAGALPLPLLIPLYAALRSLAPLRSFLWVKDLARSDAALALIAGLLGFAGMILGADPGRIKPWVLAVGGVVTLVVLARLSAGIALYWIGAQGVGLLRGALLRRRLLSAE